MSNLQNLAVEHYSRAEVQKEIAEFCKNRWMAAHCIAESGKLVFRRYLGGKPMAIKSAEDFATLLEEAEGVWLEPFTPLQTSTL
jgi:hypothetical protein